MYDILSNFHLSKDESRIYIFLGRYGPREAIFISRLLKMPRTKTYSVLNSLQRKGLLANNIGYPTRYVACLFKDAMQDLIDSEQERLNDLKKKLEEFEKLRETISNFSMLTIQKEPFLQILQGKNMIITKIKKMCESASKLIILGTEKEFVMFYHSEILDILNKSVIDVKIISSCTPNITNFFKNIDRNKITIVSEESIEGISFIIKDDNEAISFIKNEDQHQHEMMAIRTNSTSMINLLNSLFNSINSLQGKLDADSHNKLLDPYEFKIRELEQQRLILESLSDILTTKQHGKRGKRNFLNDSIRTGSRGKKIFQKVAERQDPL